MLGYTGTYRGKRVSVQGSGMGIPSALIYAEELIEEYGVKNLIRVGTAGSYQADIKLRDIVIALSASTNSNLNSGHFGADTFAPTANFELLMRAIRAAEKMKLPIKAGNVLSEDLFYNDHPGDYRRWADYGVLCAEMESAGIYSLAAKKGVRALSILTISDSKVSGENCAPEEREQGFALMVELALELL